MGKTVLMVDDDLTSLKIAEMLLQKKRYDVWTASTGMQALERLKQCVPDVILLDIEMPGMDGFETLEHIRGVERNKNIRILFLTASDDVQGIMERADGKVQGYLRKPFLPDALYRAVETE